MKRMLLAALAAAIALPCAAQTPPGLVWRSGMELDLPGNPGTLRAEFVRPKTDNKGGPVVVILPGSGPTDRDGNNSYGVRTDAYHQLSEGLAEQGITSLRPDKRGMFSSADAAANANQVFVDALAADANRWAAEARARTGAPCAWLAGHSEGALVALIAAQTGKDICGLVLISGPGRPLGLVIREQLKANPGNAPYLDEAFRVLSELEAGRKADISRLPAAFGSIFHPAIQDYMINLLAENPARLAANYKGPILILQGTTDLQTTTEDANALKVAQPSAKLVMLDGVNHVLKTAPADRATNLATYANPNLPLGDGVVSTIAQFIKAHPGTN